MEGDADERRLLHRGRSYEVTRGRRTKAGPVVVVKGVRAGAADMPDAAARLLREYRVLQALHGDRRAPSLPRPLGLQQVDGLLQLVLEDAGPRTLQERLEHRDETQRARLAGDAGLRTAFLTEFLARACELTEALLAVHGRGLAHLEITPRNIVLDPDGHATLIDFDRAINLTETPAAVAAAPEVVTAYTAPEATGRMSRPVDARTDLYSLGAVLHHMLTGAPPFAATTPLELAHAHLAQAPVAPMQLQPAVPPLLSDLVGKLLAKMPEARYQTAKALLADLREARRRLDAEGRIEPFELGLLDAVRAVPLTDKLYQRESERAALLRALAQAVAGEAPVVVLTGAAGVGKTALAVELRSPTHARGGHYAAGKVEQQRGGAPYAALAEALQSLVLELLAEGPRAGERWRGRLHATLSGNARVVVELCPALERLLGETRPVPLLGPVETENRFRLVVQALLAALSDAEHPLVIALEDLQWADAASVRLFEYLATSATLPHCLLLFAVRTEEPSALPGEVQSLLGAREQEGRAITRIDLGPLDAAGLTLMLHELLACPIARAGPLAQLVLRKTGGNPLFVGRLLWYLQRAGFLTFDASAGSWQWDLASLERVDVTDNVVDFLLAALGRLPAEARALVKTAACIGRRFELGLLAAASDFETDAAIRALEPALREGLLVERADAAGGPSYEFPHDRVQQAASALLSASEAQELHLRLGRLLRDQPDDLARERALFAIADHLQRATALITDGAERLALAALDLRAGRRARRSSAHGAAATYLQHGIELLPAAAWREHHALSFDLHREAIECTFALGEYARAMALFERALAGAETAVERATLDAVCVAGWVAQSELHQGLRHGEEGLRRLGVVLPEAGDDPAIAAELLAIEPNLAGRTLSELTQAPGMTEPLPSAVMALMANTLVAAFSRNAPLATYMMARRVNLSLVHGVAPSTPRAYLEYAVLLQRMSGDYERARSFSQLALAVARTAGGVSQEAQVKTIFTSSMSGLFVPMRAVFGLLREAHQQDIEAGDVLFASGCVICRVIFLAFQGVEFGRLLDEIDHALRALHESGVRSEVERLRVYQQMIRRLQGLGEPDENEPPPDHGSADRGCETVRILAAYVLGDFAQARALLQQLEPVRGTLLRWSELVEYTFYGALTAAALATTAAPEARRALEAEVAHHLQLLGRWERFCPETYEHKRLLVEAEQARLEGRNAEASTLYDRAIDGAGRTGFLLDEAIGSELYGRFSRGLGRRRTADWLLGSAMTLYRRFGAGAKVQALATEFPDLDGSPDALPAGVATPDDDGESALDRMGLLRAAETISSEVVLDRLLDALMRVCLATAGAGRAALVVEEDGGAAPFVRAIGVAGESVWLQRTPLAASDQVPVAAIEYVRRTQEPLVLGDAVHHASFAADRYVASQRVRSLLALPIVRQGKRVGVLSLENNLVTRAFTPQRIRVLQLLSSQIAISLDNSLLFEKLTHEIGERQRAEDRLRFLAESGAALAQSLEFQATLTRVGQLAVTSLADWCAIDLVEQATLRRVVAIHRDADKQALLQTPAALAGTTGGSTASARVVLTGRPVLFPEVGPELLAELAPDPGTRRALVDAGCRTVMIVPLGLPGHLFGALTFAAGAERRFGPEDLSLAEELSRRAALALDNARLYRESRDAVRHRDEFLSIASHELNTPIAVLTLTLDNMKQAERAASRPSDASALSGLDRARLLGVADRQSRRLSRLVGDLLDVTRLEAGPLPLERQVVALVPLVREAVASFAPELERSGCAYSIIVAPGAEDLCGDWDPRRLAQVVRNLLSNAAKFGAQAPIEIHIAARDGRAELSVRDRGIGLSPAAQPRIFDRFARGVSPTHYGGLGLGLYISRHLVEAHGGTIAVRSQPGAGATFVVSLPCCPPA